MKNKIRNTVGYTGIVTLSQYINNKKIQVARVHNTGGASLFNFLAYCLAGDFTLAKAYTPTKIKLLKRTGKKISEYSYESVTNFIWLRTPPEPKYSSSESRVRFSFIIPKDFLQSLVLDTTEEALGIGLYSNAVADNDTEVENFMAFCTIDELNRNDLANTFLVVDWELIIANTQVSSK